MKRLFLLTLLFSLAFKGLCDLPSLVKMEAKLYLNNGKNYSGFLYFDSETLWMIDSTAYQKQEYNDKLLLRILGHKYLHMDSLPLFSKVYPIPAIGEATPASNVMLIGRKSIVKAELIKLYRCVKSDDSSSQIDCFDGYPETQFSNSDIQLFLKNNIIAQHDYYDQGDYEIQLFSFNPSIKDAELKAIGKKSIFKGAEGDQKGYMIHYQKLREELRKKKIVMYMILQGC